MEKKIKDKDKIEYAKLWVELAAIVKDNPDGKVFRPMTNAEVASETSYLFKEMMKDIK